MFPNMQIGPIDKIETKRQVKCEIPKVNSKRIKLAASYDIDIFDEASEVNSPKNESDELLLSDIDDSKNYHGVTKVGSAAILYGVSNRAAAAISTAALSADKYAGFISKNCDILIDKNKIKRTKDKIMSNQTKLAETTEINAIFFDGRKDLTNVLLSDTNAKMHPGGNSKSKNADLSACQ